MNESAQWIRVVKRRVLWVLGRWIRGRCILNVDCPRNRAFFLATNVVLIIFFSPSGEGNERINFNYHYANNGIIE